MKKIILIAIIFSTLLLNVEAQCTMNIPLYNKVKDGTEKNNNSQIDVLFQGNIQLIKQLITSSGGIFKYSAGDIASVSLPLNKINEVCSQKGVERIEVFSNGLRPLNDTMLKNNNVIPVHNGQLPLTQGYDGTGIVIGFIDTGIDFTHPDFQDSLGNSRVKYLWDQNLPNGANTPMPYNYGQEFTNSNIDAGLASASSDVNGVGHGTHTAGIAVGNGLGSGHYKGVAPKADIIMVGLNFSANHSILVDGINYIFAKATAMGKPCVVNASVGDNLGSHDGKDLQAQLISNMINAQAGRSLVAAAGNDGDPNFPMHLGYNVTADTNFTFYSYTPNVNNSIYLQMFSDVPDLNNVSFSVGADQMTPTHSFRGHIPFSNVISHIGNIQNDTLFNNGHRIGIVQTLASTYAGPAGPTYLMEFNIIPDSTAYYWRIITTGSGKFDIWSYNVISNTYVFPPLPTPATMPDSVYYKLPDSDKTVCSSFQCLDNVITVGSYFNRKTYIDYDNILFVNNGVYPGYIDWTSSVGPTRDGRIKPDICSPGNSVISAVVLSMVQPYWIAGGANYLISQDQLHVCANGTSAASPGVAGIAALYLQRFPGATAMQVKNAIINCATQDNCTGSNLPNNIWGYGKANAFYALTGCGVGVGETPDNSNPILIYPNPATEGSVLTITVSNFNGKDKTEMDIYNAIGEVVKSITITSPVVQLNNVLPSGVYFCNLKVNGKKIVTKKLVVL